MKKDAVKNRPTLASADLPPPKQGCCSAVGWMVAYATAFLGKWDCPKLAPKHPPLAQAIFASGLEGIFAYATAFL